MLDIKNLNSSTLKQKNLLFLNEELNSIQTLIDTKVDTRSTSQIEFEIRIRPYDPVHKKDMLFSIQDIQRISRECKLISTSIQYQKDVVVSKTEMSEKDIINHRKILQSDGNVYYEKKIKPSNMKVDVMLVTGLKWDDEDISTGHKKFFIRPDHLPLSRVRFSKNIEIQSSSKIFDSISSNNINQRTRNRTIYILSSIIQIHITEIQEGNTEIEIEIDSTKIENVKHLIQLIKPIFQLLYPKLNSYYSFSRFKAEKLGMLPSFITPLTRPVNIQEKHFTPNLLKYGVTNKLDGIEYKLWFHKKDHTKMDIILFNNTQLWFVQRLPFVIENDLPLLICEVVNHSSGLQIHVFDISSPYDYNTKSYNLKNIDILPERLNQAQNIVSFVMKEVQKKSISLDFQLKVKHFEIPSEESSQLLVGSIQKMLFYMGTEYGLNGMEEENDGIILEPIESSLSLPTLKWKFPSKVSIDFKMKKQSKSSNTYDLLASNGSSFSYLEHEWDIRSRKIYATITFRQNDICEGLNCSQLDNLIGEFIFSNKEWKLLRIRWDKNKPNSGIVASETYKDIINIKTLPWVISNIQKIEIEKDNTFIPVSDTYRKYANLIKKDMIEIWCENKSVLDIGSGMGGDMSKYQDVKVKQLYMVEPNKYHIQELRNRLKDMNINIPYKIIETGGENYSLISSSINSKVDIVSMMLSLTYFYSSENKLDELVKTITTSISHEGSIIGTVMNGEKVGEFLEENGQYIKRSCFSIVPEYHANSYSPIITTHLHNTQTASNITEALVYIDRLSEKLDPYGLTMTEFKSFYNSSPFLLDNKIIQKELIRLKIYNDLKEELISIFGSSILPRLQYYILCGNHSEDYIFIESSRYDPSEYLEQELLQTSSVSIFDKLKSLFKIESSSESSQEDILKGFKFIFNNKIKEGLDLIKNISNSDSDLVIKQNKVTYINNETNEEIYSINTSEIHGTSLLHKHQFANLIRKQYFTSHIPTHKLLFDKIGYSSNDNILEAYSSPENHFFNQYCSFFPDIDEGSIGRFEDLDSFISPIIYIIPLFHRAWIQLLLSKIYSLAPYYTIVLIIPVQYDLTNMIEKELSDIIWNSKEYSNNLIEISTNKSIPHMEYLIGIKRQIISRQIVIPKKISLLDKNIQLTRDESRLIGLYNTFVYQSYKLFEFPDYHPFHNTISIGYILKQVSFLNSFLMSYLGPSYYSNIDIDFRKKLIDGYKQYEFNHSPLSLHCVKLQSDILSSLPTIPSYVRTGAEWISATSKKEDKDIIYGLLALLLDNLDVDLYMPQICCDKLNIAIVIIYHNMELNPIIYKGHIIDEVVFVSLNEESYHSTRIKGTSRGVISHKEALKYSWYPFGKLQYNEVDDLKYLIV
jgi:hypothetical protein